MTWARSKTCLKIRGGKRLSHISQLSHHSFLVLPHLLGLCCLLSCPWWPSFSRDSRSRPLSINLQPEHWAQPWQGKLWTKILVKRESSDKDACASVSSVRTAQDPDRPPLAQGQIKNTGHEAGAQIIPLGLSHLKWSMSTITYLGSHCLN